MSGGVQFDWAEFSEADRVAFYCAQIAMGAVDGSLDKDEVSLIYETLDLEGLSRKGKKTIEACLEDPKDVPSYLNQLSQADETLRFGLMMTLIDVAWSDERKSAKESKTLKQAQRILRISDEQYEAMEAFVSKAKKIRDRGVDDNYAADLLKTGAAGLTAVGVPIAAVYFSGSVIGLSAAGITSGLAALGLGLGMVPGIGVAIIVGVGIFCAARWLLDPGNTRKKEQLKAERDLRAQKVIKNLQETINLLTERIQKLQRSADKAIENAEAIRKLNERLSTLQKAVSRRQALLKDN